MATNAHSHGTRSRWTCGGVPCRLGSAPLAIDPRTPGRLGSGSRRTRSRPSGRLAPDVYAQRRGSDRGGYRVLSPGARARPVRNEGSVRSDGRVRLASGAGLVGSRHVETSWADDRVANFVRLFRLGTERVRGSVATVLAAGRVRHRKSSRAGVGDDWAGAASLVRMGSLEQRNAPDEPLSLHLHGKCDAVPAAEAQRG